MEITSQYNIEDIPLKIVCDESDKSQINKYPNFIRNFKITGGYISILLGITSLLLPIFDYPVPYITGWPTDVIPFYRFLGILSLIIGISILKKYLSIFTIIIQTLWILGSIWIFLIWAVYLFNNAKRVLEFFDGFLDLWPF